MKPIARALIVPVLSLSLHGLLDAPKPEPKPEPKKKARRKKAATRA